MPYSERYLAGVLLFNQEDYFEAHEVWEDLWAESTGDERRFYQSLIQAAVGLCHYGNGNLRGAVKLYHTSRNYMTGLPDIFLGLDTGDFWRQMSECFAPLLTTSEPPRSSVLNEERLPTIQLNPQPAAWPDPASFVNHED